MTTPMQTRPPAQGNAPGGQPGASAPTVKPWPFPVNVLPGDNNSDYDTTITMGAATVRYGDVRVDPSGWLRGIWFDFTGTAAANSATVTFNGDVGATTTGAPFIAIDTVLLTTTGGDQIFGPFNGYDWMTTNKYGGYQAQGDPRADQNYSTTTSSATNAGSFHFTLYLPLEVSSSDAFGTVENRSENSIYRVQVTLATSTTMYTQAPTALPTVEMKTIQDSYYDPVAERALGGRPVSTAPPAVGSVQYWKQEDDASVPASVHSSYITNGIGYGYRNVIFKLIRTSGTRAQGTSDWPDPQEITLGTTRLRNMYKKNWQDRQSRLYQYTNTTVDNALGPESGVFVLPFTQDTSMFPGDEARRKYLRTQSGDTFKVRGTYGNAGTLWMTENFVIPRNNDFSQVVA